MGHFSMIMWVTFRLTNIAPAEGETRYTYDAAGHLVRVELYTAGAYIPLAEAALDRKSVV